jgi:hypothetical protein
MPTSSQSQILSVVDYQLLSQQHAGGQDGTTKQPARISLHQASINDQKRQHRNEDHRSTMQNKNGGDNRSPSPPNVNDRRRSSGKINDGKFLKYQTFRTLFSLKTSHFFQQE